MERLNLVTGVTGMPAIPTQFPYVKSICPPLSHLSHLSHFPPYTLNSPLFSCCRLINMAVSGVETKEEVE